MGFVVQGDHQSGDLVCAATMRLPRRMRVPHGPLSASVKRQQFVHVVRP